MLGESLKVSAFALMLGLLHSGPVRPISLGGVLLIVVGDDLRFVYIVIHAPQLPMEATETHCLQLSLLRNTLFSPCLIQRVTMTMTSSTSK